MLALRGDLPYGWTGTNGDFAYATDLVCLLYTSGLRRKSKVREELERYSIIRTVTAVERADVVIVVIDAVEGITEQDAKIAGIAHDRGKGIIVAINKWDAIEKNDKTVNEFSGKFVDRFVILLDGIPFIDGHDDSLAPVMGNPRNLCVLLCNPLDSVDNHDHHIRPLDGGHRPYDAVPLQLFPDFALPPQARCV